MDEDKGSHKQLLKSTSIIGGTQVIGIILGIIKTKVAAILLGPAGIGLIGVLQSIIDIVNQVTSFGINFSSVKDLAEANSSKDELKISQTVTILRRWALGTGLLGVFLTVVFCIPLSKYSFGNSSYSLSVAFISLSILFGSLSGGQLALLQGLRQIGQLAKATLLGAILGLLVTLPLYWWLGQNGIVPGMVLSAFILFVTSWLYARKIRIKYVALSLKETYKGGLGMARLGFFMIITGFLSSATLYVVRTFLVDKMGLDAVGYFQACWMITNIYLGILLNAMLADYFPKLTGLGKDDIASNKLINEQIEIALLVGVPMIVGVIALATIIIQFLYSSTFILAIPVLQWQVAGTFFTLISWPLSIMFFAKNKGIYSLITECIWSFIFISFIYFAWHFYGFATLGIAFLIAGVVRTLAIYCVTWHLGRFKFSYVNIKFFFIYGILVVLVLANVRLCKGGLWQYAISAGVIMVTMYLSYISLNKMVNLREFVGSRIRKKIQ